MRSFESLGQYHDMWSFLLAYAPDGFRDIRTREVLVDQSSALNVAFSDLRSGFTFAQRKIKNDRLARIAAELVEMSLEAYSAGDATRGSHILQECEGLIWTGKRLQIKYGIEAEQRAFGENITYANIKITPYPYEGTRDDLSDDQARLLEIAHEHCLHYLSTQIEFRYFSWIVDNDGVVRRTSAMPVQDQHPTLKPLQKSWGYKHIKELATSEQIQACVLASVLGPLGDGLLVYDLEQRDCPRVSARLLFKRGPSRNIAYESMRFHLEDAQFFVVPEAPAADDSKPV